MRTAIHLALFSADAIRVMPSVQATPNAFAGLSLSQIADKAEELALLARQRANDEAARIAAGREQVIEGIWCLRLLLT